MSIKLINSGDYAETVQVLSAEGVKDQVQLQPKGGKLTLPLGYTLCPVYVSTCRARVLVNGQPINKYKGA